MEEEARIVLGLRSPELAEEVMDFLDRSGRARVVGSASDGPGLAEAVRRLSPHAVVGQPEVVRGTTTVNGSAFLAVDTVESVASLRDALDAGARGYYLWPQDRADLVLAAAGTLPPDDSAGPGRAAVIAVYGPRGGVGATFVATHLAAAFARRRLAAVLVDLDPVFGDVSGAVGVPPGEAVRTATDLAPLAQELSDRHLEEVLWAHPAGFRVLLAPQDPGEAERTGLFTYTNAIAVLRRSSDVVVLHPPRALDRISVAGLEAADPTLVVVSLDVLAVRAARRALARLAALGVDERCRVVVNRAVRSEIAPRDVERALGRPVVAIVPSDRRVAGAQDRGRLLAGGGGAVRALDRLAGVLLDSLGSERGGAGASVRA